jgi:RimJ/RimL family protein N-acetyltransferase
MSCWLWGVDWRAHLPWELDEGVTVDPGDLDTALPFIQEHYGAIFESEGDDRFLHEPLDPPKLRFLSTTDIFLFHHGTRLIGVLIAHPTDWSSYYIRTTGFLKEYQSRGYGFAWAERACEVLAAAGVGRIEAETTPNNFACIRVLTRLGFNITSTVNSERWGNMVRFTKFLSEDAETHFLDQFCTGVLYQRRARDGEPERRKP